MLLLLKWNLLWSHFSDLGSQFGTILPQWKEVKFRLQLWHEFAAQTNIISIPERCFGRVLSGALDTSENSWCIQHVTIATKNIKFPIHGFFNVNIEKICSYYHIVHMWVWKFAQYQIYKIEIITHVLRFAFKVNSVHATPKFLKNQLYNGSIFYFGGKKC